MVGIGAICDFATGAPEPESSRGQSFSIEEFVVLEDGRHVVLTNDRGFTVSSVRELVELEDWRRMVLENVAPARAGLTPDSIRKRVLNAVLPDDDERGEDYTWSWLAELARRQGIDVTADELKALPYEVILTER